MNETLWAVIIGGLLVLLAFAFNEEKQNKSVEEEKEEKKIISSKWAEKPHAVVVEIDKDCWFISADTFTNKKIAGNYKRDMELCDPTLNFEIAEVQSDGMFQIVEEESE